MEDKEFINQLKYLIETYTDKDPAYETGFVQGIFYAYNYKLHGKAYADERLRAHSDGRKLSEDCGCGCEGRDGGC